MADDTATSPQSFGSECSGLWLVEKLRREGFGGKLRIRIRYKRLSRNRDTFTLVRGPQNGLFQHPQLLSTTIRTEMLVTVITCEQAEPRVAFGLLSKVNHNGPRPLRRITSPESPPISFDHRKHAGCLCDRTQRAVDKRAHFAATLQKGDQNERHETQHRVLSRHLG